MYTPPSIVFGGGPTIRSTGHETSRLRKIKFGVQLVLLLCVAMQAMKRKRKWSSQYLGFSDMNILNICFREGLKHSTTPFDCGLYHSVRVW